ncbi:hypothetical protein [Leptolyngbya sp. 7M]|uniref:hypothetical protein n=1 Tax=Leptolyngbya sp. 7M TaxID=2812896 RepID=UPI001B8D6E45|nr:hypothetical protein [Leptolyngbya sp. 7M]QYO63042.1 hypothetical protein JVX88_24100 [Leptolyngbya sp. 7M]
MTRHDVYTIAIDQAARQVEIKIPVPLKREDKERLKVVVATLIDLAIELPDKA